MAEADGSLWVSNVDAYTVQRIDPATNEVTATVDTEPYPDGLLAAAGAVWVASDLGPVLSRVDPAADAVSGIWDVSDQGAIRANQLLVEAAGGFWMPLLESGEVVQVAVPS
jgi:YVTN family beta-propeller protein